MTNPRTPKALVGAALASALVLALSACSTVEGVGKDINAGGRIISDTARDVKEEL
jgi:entericidin B